jgi:hypothetical protein
VVRHPAVRWGAWGLLAIVLLLHDCRTRAASFVRVAFSAVP